MKKITIEIENDNRKAVLDHESIIKCINIDQFINWILFNIYTNNLRDSKFSSLVTRGDGCRQNIATFYVKSIDTRRLIDLFIESYVPHWVQEEFSFGEWHFFNKKLSLLIEDFNNYYGLPSFLMDGNFYIRIE